jgi:predicted RNA methylase
MRRWVIIILLLVYPLQAALAVADKCCVTTPAGLTHHSAGPTDAVAAEPMFVADDDRSALADPHCAACMFGHVLYLPSDAVVIPGERHHASTIAFDPPFLTAPPVARFERPKWSAAAD